MRLPPFVIIEPGTKRNALKMLDKHRDKLKIIAGGTEVIVNMKLGLLSPLYVMSLKKIRGIKGIKKIKNEIVIGSTTTIYEILKSPLINKMFKGIREAAESIAAPPLQNRATIGGNILQNTRCIYYNQSEIFRNGISPCFKAGGTICHATGSGKRCFSVYQGDMASSLISFDASVRLEKQGSHRTIPLSELFTGRGENPLSIEENELLTEVVIPVPDLHCSSSYEKLRIRSGIEYPLASAAVFLAEDKDRTIKNARIVIGAGGSSPRIINNLLPDLKNGNPYPEDMEKIAESAEKSVEVVNNLSTPASYRRKMVKVLTKRALKRALDDLKGDSHA